MKAEKKLQNLYAFLNSKMQKNDNLREDHPFHSGYKLLDGTPVTSIVNIMKTPKTSSIHHIHGRVGTSGHKLLLVDIVLGGPT